MRGSHLLLLAPVLCGACSDAPTGTTDAPRPSFITRHFDDDNVHTWVGLIVFYDANGEFSHRCSGSLISSTKFLTAGHCTTDVNSARIWFAQDAGMHFDPATEFDPVSGYPDTCLPQAAPCVTSHLMFNYGFGSAGFPDTHDAGVVILDEPVTTIGFGQLAAAGTLDALANRRGQQDVTFVSSGYGISRVEPTTLSFREQLMAESQLVNLSNALTDGFNVQLTNSPGKGRGGTCSGDSGGPLLYQDQIVGLTSFGFNRICAGVGFDYRVDRAEVLAWIADPS